MIIIPTCYSGYATSPRSTEVLTAGDNTVVYSDHTVSWDGSATSHAALVRSASSEKRCVAATCRRVVWGDSEGVVGEIEPNEQPVGAIWCDYTLSTCLEY